MVAITEDLIKLLHFRDPQTSADILWLLKHVRLVHAGSMHPTGMLLINIHRAAKQKVMAVTKPRWRPFPILFLDLLCSLKTSSTTSQQTTKLARLSTSLLSKCLILKSRYHALFHYMKEIGITTIGLHILLTFAGYLNVNFPECWPKYQECFHCLRSNMHSIIQW